MLSVEIYVNSMLVGKETAIRVSGDEHPDSLNIYKLSDGCVLAHRYGDGAVKLAEFMMQHLDRRKNIGSGKK